MQDDGEFCSRDLAATSQLCDLLGPTPASLLLTPPSVIRSRMPFGRLDLTCHLARDCSGRGSLVHRAVKSPHPAALLLLMLAA